MDYLLNVIDEVKETNSKVRFVEAPLASLEFGEDGVMSYGDIHGLLSQEALKQLEGMLNIPGSNFLKGAPVEISHTVINYYKNKLIESGVRIKIKGQSGSFSSDKLGFWITKAGTVFSFGRTDTVQVTNSELLGNIVGLLPKVAYYQENESGIFIQLFSEDIRVRVDIDEEDYDWISPGISIHINTADSSMEGQPFIYSTESESGIIVGNTQKLKPMKSTRNDEADYVAEFYETCNRLFEIASTCMEAVIKSSEVNVPSIPKMLDRITKEYKIKEEIADIIYDNTEMDGTDKLRDVVIGISRAAECVLDFGSDTYEKIQKLAGNVLLDNSKRCPVCDSVIGS